MSGAWDVAEDWFVAVCALATSRWDLILVLVSCEDSNAAIMSALSCEQKGKKSVLVVYCCCTYIHTSSQSNDVGCLRPPTVNITCVRTAELQQFVPGWFSCDPIPSFTFFSSFFDLKEESV